LLPILGLFEHESKVQVFRAIVFRETQLISISSHVARFHTVTCFTRFSQSRRREKDVSAGMELSQFFPLGEGLELSRVEMSNGELVLHIRATSSSVSCPLCAQPATRLHSRYVRAVKDLPCAEKPLHLILHVRKFFCDAADCARKIFAERLPQLVARFQHT